jgi:hypothetical protein
MPNVSGGEWIFPRAGVTQLVECDLAKVDVAGSNPVSRSKIPQSTQTGRFAVRRGLFLASVFPQRNISFGV